MGQGPTTAASLLSRVRDPSDHEAWRQFDDRYRKFLLRFCWRRGIARTDAEDIVQRVFTSLVRTLPQFTYDPNRGRFRDYLFRCTRNAIHEWRLRPEQRIRALGLNGDAPCENGPASAEETHAWESEWVAHHYRLALDTVRQTFDPQSVELFDRMVAGAAPLDLAQEYRLSESAVYKVRQRVRDRMEELIAHQVRQEDMV